MNKHFNIIGFKTMPLFAIVLVILNYTLMMIGFFTGNWITIAFSSFGLVASHYFFKRAFDTEKAFDDFLNGKVN
jgi:hypothetical protein